MGKSDQFFDKEKTNFNVARFKTGGETFEVVIHPDVAVEYRNGKNVDLRDALVSEKVFSDAKKGLLASEHIMEKLFSTSDALAIIGTILKKGDIQLTADYRQKLREQKRKRIVQLIHRNGIDPQSGLPHPPQRIENAIEEAKASIDEHKAAEDQVQDILKKIRTVLPIRLEVREVQVQIPAQYAAKAYALMKNFGTVLKDEWQNDGSLLSVIELPAGLQQDFFSELNSLTHGTVHTSIIKTK